MPVEVPAWLLRAPQGPWSLRKWVAGLGVVPCFSGSQRSLPGEVGPAAREGGLHPVLIPRVFRPPAPCPVPSSDASLVLDFLPPLPGVQRAGGFSLPTDI